MSVEFERAATGERYSWKTKVQHKTYTVSEIAQVMYERLDEAQDPHDSDLKMRTVYTDQFPISKLENIVKESLQRIGCKEATEGMRQKFLQAMGTLRRKQSENVRYTPIVNRYKTISTKSRQAVSASAIELRNNKTLFYTEQTQSLLGDEQLEFFNEVIEPGSGFKAISVDNYHDFKTPVNLAIAEYENERRFMRGLLDPANAGKYDAWIKSAPVRFYDIDYAWKKGEHPKRGKFSPDFLSKWVSSLLSSRLKVTRSSWLLRRKIARRMSMLSRISSASTNT